jgi:hypothetical protein
MRYGLQVPRVAAQAVSAQVVKHQIGLDWSDNELVHGAMN